MRPAAAAGMCVVAAVALVGCGPDERTAADGFDYQLGGAYDSALDTVVRDSTGTPLAGAYSICYVNGFQTQPGSKWNADLLLTGASGELLVDPEWPDEHILDPSTPDKRSRIDAVVGSIVDGCAAAGFDAVEVDNLDTWTRFPDRIDEDSVLALARLYADRAHASGMEIAQKNSPDGAERIRADVGFDFAIAEECLAYDECASYTQVYGSRVYDVEYTDNVAEPFAELCVRGDRAAVTILRDRNLVSPDDPEYVYEQC